MNLLAYRDTGLIRLLHSLGLVVQRHDLYGADVLSFSPWPAFSRRLLLTGLIAFLIGVPVIRLKGHYLAMATLGFGLIIYRVVLGTKVFGQADGISNVPPFPLIPGLEVNGRPPFRVQNYYIAWAVVLVAMVLAINLVHSRVGRALRSIHQNEEAAHSLGVNTYRYKLATSCSAPCSPPWAGFADPLQRQHRPVRGDGHEVRAIRGHRRRRRHGQPVGRAAHGRPAELPVAARRVRDLRRRRVRGHPDRHHALRSAGPAARARVVSVAFASVLSRRPHG